MPIVSTLLLVSLLGSQEIQRGCDLADVDGSREVHDALSLRAVDIVARSASDAWSNDNQLRSLVSPSATFGLGSGDVGRPLATGRNGARALAILVDAQSYRFYGWDYMDLPANACAQRKISVEFVGRDGETSSIVEFTFDQARLIAATGWQRSFQSGPLTSVP